jgi:hypothetical protein
MRRRVGLAMHRRDLPARGTRRWKLLPRLIDLMRQMHALRGSFHGASTTRESRVTGSGVISMRRTIAALVVVFTAHHAGAADAPGKGKAAPGRPLESRGKAVAKKDPLADVTHCKRVAHGTEGPERARLMTECIRRN